MKFRALVALICWVGVGALSATDGSAQSRKKSQASVKIPIFAVLNGGTTVEPIGYINSKGQMSGAVDGASERPILNAFHKSYYAKGKVFPLIFGGAPVGTATVVSADPSAECSNFLGEVRTKTSRTPLKGNVMALATVAQVKTSRKSERRAPTVQERSEIETLVRSEFAKQGLSKDAVAKLKSHNLTVLDVDGDSNPEFVGSYWIDVSATKRGLLFFIASRNSDGKIVVGHSAYNAVDQADTMSKDIKSVDEGVYHELLLDVFDVDGDGVAEVFTYTPSFEGAGFNVYKRSGKGWALHFEGSNYHCGY